MPHRSAPQDQQAVIDFLAAGEAYGLPGASVDRIDTHAAIVFLAGERAYKMKRAVRYSFLDFSTLERRHDALEAELRLNRRTAPQLYRRVLPVTLGGGGMLQLDGEGEPVEWLLEMARFAQEELLDNIAARGGLDDALIDRLAREIVEFHRKAEARTDCGGFPGMALVLEGNEEDLARLAGEVLDVAEIAALTEASRQELGRHRELLEQRREEGRARHCHGDLHLGNIVLLDGAPVLFDCIEFDEQLACTDVLYDLAFLLMDLCHRGLRSEAQRLLGYYLELDPDLAGVALLPLFMATRAVIRAKTAGLGAGMHASPAEREDALTSARAYLALARELLSPPPPRLIAIGGISGTGKSTLALALAPAIGAAPGAVVLRSDRLRKHLFATAATTRLGPEGYRPEITAEVYRLIVERAAALLRAGHSVIADAVFGDLAQRRQIERVADEAGVPFQGFWLEAPRELLERRIEGRKGDASDATVAVLKRQLRLNPRWTPWTRLDAGAGPETVAAQARAALEAERASSHSLN